MNVYMKTKKLTVVLGYKEQRLILQEICVSFYFGFVFGFSGYFHFSSWFKSTPARYWKKISLSCGDNKAHLKLFKMKSYHKLAHKQTAGYLNKNQKIIKTLHANQVGFGLLQ